MKDRLLQVHQYWFGSFATDQDVVRQQGKLWFGKNEQVDQYIREQFSDLIESAAARQFATDNLNPQLKLAVILLLDQFTRNIYRNDPRSFASDSLARELALDQIDHAESSLRPIEKVFLYLPLEHSEDIDDQRRSVALYQALYDSVADDLKDTFAGFLDYAIRHYDIILRFGRFPHRNKILGRHSTPEELEFLTQPNSSF